MLPSGGRLASVGCVNAGTDPLTSLPMANDDIVETGFYGGFYPVRCMQYYSLSSIAAGVQPFPSPRTHCCCAALHPGSCSLVLAISDSISFHTRSQAHSLSYFHVIWYISVMPMHETGLDHKHARSFLSSDAEYLRYFKRRTVTTPLGLVIGRGIARHVEPTEVFRRLFCYVREKVLKRRYAVLGWALRFC